MASFLRGKQSGMQNDLSAGILPDLFAPDDQARYGINSQISCLAYEPIQSLVAVGTNESKYGPGKIYVFGQRRVHKFITPMRPTSFRQLQFVANKLVSLDAKSEIAVWDLDTGARLTGYMSSGGVAVLLTDPMLDWAFLGAPNGDISCFDLDRERPVPFKIPNFWRQRDPNARAVALVGLQWHPRDIGKLLIGYTHGAVVYSFKQNAATKWLEYTVPVGAPGGNGEVADSVRRPRLTQAVWHPTGSFVLTAHDDGSLVFWDVNSKDGRLVMARSLYGMKVNEKGGGEAGLPVLMDAFVSIAWCCKERPDDTALLIAGGQRMDDSQKGLTFLDLGPTPYYQTTSWEALAKHFEGKRQTTLQTPPGAEVTNFCLIPRRSPYFAGAQDPLAILTLLSSGELLVMSFPSGYAISPTNQLHPSLSFVTPFVTRFSVATLDRGRWLGMEEKRQQGELLLRGGAEAAKHKKRFQGRNIIQAVHADGTIRLWDVGHGDEIENAMQLQVDVSRALNREGVEVTATDMAQMTGEFAVGTTLGEVIVYRWGENRTFAREEPKEMQPNPGGLSDVSSRAEPSLKEGLQPLVLYEMMQGAVTVLSVSDVGFVAVGSDGGFVSIIDLRGPAIIFQACMAELAKSDKRSSIFKSHHGGAPASKEWPTVAEFAVMNLEGDSYSSIACFVGTNLGRVASFKLLPSAQGYSVKLAGVASLGERVVAIDAVVTDTGHPAAATGDVVAGLRGGVQVHGTLVVATEAEIRIFKPPTAKGASRSFDKAICHAAAVTHCELHGVALVGVFSDRTTRAFSLPGLKEIGKEPLSMVDPRRLRTAVVAHTGDVLAWTGPAEVAMLAVWGTGRALKNSEDKLINPELSIPPRPTISNLQWISGTQYVSPTDLDLLIGGPDRPASKRMMVAMAAEEKEERSLAKSRGGSPTSPRGGAQEGWGEYLTRQLNQRTERLNIIGDNMNHLQQESQGWADDVNKFVTKQKRSMLIGGITRGFL